MRGTIVYANPSRGRYAVQVDGSDFMAFELLEGIELEVGDTVTGDLEAMAGETLRSEAHGNISVFNEIVQASRETVRRWVEDR